MKPELFKQIIQLWKILTNKTKWKIVYKNKFYWLYNKIMNSINIIPWFLYIKKLCTFSL